MNGQPHSSPFVSVTTNPACVPAHNGDLDFIFVVHPRTIGDVLQAYPNLRGRSDAAVMAAVRPYPVSVISPIEVDFGNRVLRGELVSIPYLASEFRRNIREIQNALREVLAYAAGRQTKVLGLGALIPSITRYGSDLLPFARGVGITTGHSFTAYALSRYVDAVDRAIGGSRPVAIVGAAGSIGRSTARALALRPEDGKITLIDIGSRKAALAEAKCELISLGHNSVATSTDLESIKESSIVVCATNASAAIIRPFHLGPGTVVIDDSQPPNITLETAREAGATVLKCLARVPSLQCPFDYGLFPKAELAKKQTMVFTCLAETVMLAAEGYSDGFSVGSPGVDHIARIAGIAKKFGIGIAPFQGFSEIGAVSLGAS